MYENLLPLGSVVLLKGGNKRVMITGRVLARTGDEQVYDYSACFFPEGILNAREMFFFNHDAIERLYFVGCQDDEELRFRKDVLGNLGELYVDESGRIIEREQDRAGRTQGARADGGADQRAGARVSS